ncbi:MAG: sigma-70 family RNA polymerase sigma factor [Fimbriimonadaceae bacterium]|nr:sigma-70 family RNA polymerase sigma factor [Fimbriimonadaceae bacterium]
MRGKVRRYKRMNSVWGKTSLVGKADRDAELDSTIQSKCARQGLGAFSAIVDTYQARLYGFVLRMVRDPRDAEDVTQEVFVRAYQGMAAFDGRSSVRTWLFRIAHNLCVDRHRKATHRGFDRLATEDELSAFEKSDSTWDPEKLVLDGELQATVSNAVGELSEKLRAVLLLHDQEGMGYAEIAGALDIPVGTVKSRLFLARASLQQTISEYMGWNPEAGS